MIFKRRERPSWLARLREFVYPRKGFWRGFGYIGKRMRRLPDSPHRIALGFAAGALASFTPFFGFHFFVAAGLAWLVRGNVIASLFGTIVGNPLSFPLISTSSLWLGRWILGRHDEGSNFDAVTDAFGEAFKSIWSTMKSWFGYGDSMLDGFLIFLDDVFLPYLVGGLPMGAVAGFISYWTLGGLVAAYQARRSRNLEKKAAERQRQTDDQAA
ncbi:MAG: DUF2062 domain-containing protein [Pseudomonadota bacterium]